LLFREIIVVSLDSHLKHTEALWKNMEFPDCMRVVHFGITGFGMVKMCTVGMASNGMTRLHKSRVPVCLGGCYLWVCCMELASYHPPGVQNFEVISRFLDDFCTHYLWKWLDKCNKMLEIWFFLITCKLWTCRYNISNNYLYDIEAQFQYGLFTSTEDD
jgi:hypothetical protein